MEKSEQHNVAAVHGETRDLASIILRNTLAASAGSWITRIVNFLFIIYVVRLLGEVQLGRYATVVAFVGLFSVFSELGLAQYTERSIAQDRSRTQALFWDLVVLRVTLSVVGITGITLASALIYDRGLALGVLLLTLTFLPAALLTPLTIVLTGNERFDLSTAVGLLGQIITVVLGLVLLWMGLGFYALLLTGFVTMPLQIVVVVWMIRRAGLGPIPFRVRPRSWRGLILASLPFGLTSLALTFNFSVDTVILGLFRPEADVGWYNASYRLVFNAVSLVGGFLLVMTPSLAREHRLDPERVRQWVRTSMYWLVLFAVPAGAGLSLVAGRVVGVMYGRDYAASGPVLAIIAWDIPLLILLSFFGNVTAATGRERPAAAIFLFAAGINLTLNLIFIPHYGMYAAAAITVISDLLTVAMFFMLLSDTLRIEAGFVRNIVRVAMATLLMGLGVWLGGQLPIVVVLLLGGSIYLVSAICFRLIDHMVLIRTGRQFIRRGRAQQSAV